jgi:hypothetical protein
MLEVMLDWCADSSHVKAVMLGQVLLQVLGFDAGH